MIYNPTLRDSMRYGEVPDSKTTIHLCTIARPLSNSSALVEKKTRFIYIFRGAWNANAM